jgi:hypothetical protein
MASGIAALAASGLWTLLSYATEWRLALGAIMVGAVAGAAMAAASGRSVGRLGGLAAALVALAAMFGGRLVLASMEVADKADEALAATEEDAIWRLAEGMMESDPEAVEFARAEGEVPPEIWAKAERTWQRLPAEEQGEFLDAMRAEAEAGAGATLDALAPIATVVVTVVRLGFLGMFAIVVGVALACRLGAMTSAESTGEESLPIEPSNVAAPTIAAAPAAAPPPPPPSPPPPPRPGQRVPAAVESSEGMSVLRGLPKEPVDPLAGTPLGDRPLTGAPPAGSSEASAQRDAA